MGNLKGLCLVLSLVNTKASMSPICHMGKDDSIWISSVIQNTNR